MKRRYVVHVCYSQSAARQKTRRSANFVSGETAGAEGIGTLTVGYTVTLVSGATKSLLLPAIRMGLCASITATIRDAASCLRLRLPDAAFSFLVDNRTPSLVC